jgi:hypothetical protein
MSEESVGAARMCRDKKRYKDQIAAFCALGRIQVIFGHDQRAYLCPICHGYHLTKRPKREQEIEQEKQAVALFTR